MRCVRIGLAGLAIALAGCSSAGSTSAASRPSPSSGSPSATAPTQSPAAHLSAPWPTYHGDTARSGFVDSRPPTPPLRRAWSRQLDGAVYAQPIVVGDLLVAATENNSLYALRAETGQVVWRRHLGTPIRLSDLPCGNIDPLGITGTPAYDAHTGSVFVVTETAGGRHDLHAIDARHGTLRWTRNLDVVDRDRRAQQQRAALLVAHHRVYVAFGGLFGDCGNYVGYVTGVTTGGRGPVLHYEVPTAREAGIWAPPGPVLDASGALLVAIGNGSSTGGGFDGSDSVTRLSPSLHRLGFFAPSTWAADNAADLDLGSSSPVLVGKHIVIAGKRGTVYLLASALGGIGHQLATLDGCAAYGGGATAGTAVLLPCNDGLRRLDVNDSNLAWSWRTPDVTGSPLIVRDTVYAISAESGDLYAVDLRSGRTRDRIHLGDLSRFATPAPAGRLLVVGTKTGVVAVTGER